MGQIALLQSKKFAPLFVTQFLGAFNDNFLKNALVILITFRAKSVFGISSSEMVPVAAGIFILPFFLFSATSGQLADKYEKTTLIRWIKAVEIGIMLLATAGFVAQHFEFLMIVLFLMGLHSTFFGPIKYSILPQHLNNEELIAGNALVEAGTFLAILLGTLCGGILISYDFGPKVVSACLVAAAIVGWITSLVIPKAGPVDTKLKVRWNPIPPTLEIFEITRRNRTVFLSVLGISWFWFFGAAFLSLFPPYCKDLLHGNEALVTLFLTLFSIGIGLGSILCGRLSRRRLELGLVPLGSIGMTTFAFDLYWVGVPHFLPVGPITPGWFLGQSFGQRIAFDLFMLAVFSGFFIVPLYTLVQERSELSHRSRIIAGNNILNALFMVFASALIFFMMHNRFSIPEIFLTLALINAAVAVYIYGLLPEFLFRFVAWMLANMLYRLKIKGEENLPEEGAAVLACNHVSFVDWMIISAAVKRPVRFIMDYNFAKGFLLKRILAKAKVILIATLYEDPKLLREAFERTSLELRAGEIVCIFPEGKITRHGKLNEFKGGIDKIVREDPVPVIPMALVGLWGSVFSRKGGKAIFKIPCRLWLRVELRIGPAISPKDFSVAKIYEKVVELKGNDL